MKNEKIAKASPFPVLRSYSSAKALQEVMLPLQVEQGEHNPSSADIVGHLRRHDVERAHNGDEEGEDGKRDKLHDWGVRGGSGRVVRRNRGQSRVFISNGSEVLPEDAWNDVLDSRKENHCNLDVGTWVRAHIHELHERWSLSDGPIRASPSLDRWSLVKAVRIPCYHEGMLH